VTTGVMVAVVTATDELRVAPTEWFTDVALFGYLKKVQLH